MIKQADRHAYIKFIRQGMFIMLVVCVLCFFIIFFPSGSHLVILLLSLALLVTSIRNLYPYISATNWIETQATINNIREVEEKVVQSESGPTRYYYPDVSYQYVHMGIQYESNRVSFEKQNIWLAEHHLWGDRLKDTDKFWHAWQPGSTIPVYVDPKNPRQSVLISDLSPKRRSHHYALLAAGILTFMVWLLVLYIAMR